MPNNIKRKTVNYRRCDPTPPAGASPSMFKLEELVRKAGQNLLKPWVRQIGMGGTQAQFLTYLVNKQGCLCGALVQYETDKKIPLVDFDPASGATWEAVVEPKDGSGKKRKLEEQALFFAIRENHVAVIQNKELSISDLQDFLVWFIQTRALLAVGWSFTLLNLPSASAIEKLKESEIKGVKIGKKALWMEKELDPTAGTQGKKKKYLRTLKTDPLFFPLLRKLTNNNELVDDLTNSSDPGSVYVSLEISYRSRSEKDGQKLMREMAATFGDMAELAPEIRLKGSGRIKGSELTICGQVDVQAPSGNVSKDDAMTRVAEWLKDSINTGKVST